jgi:histidyl-tRNA synthetase
MTQPIQTLKGFRDFLPQEKRARDYVADKIKETFELFGFEPIETPTLEYASLLTGKYGEEADKLVYTFEDRGGRKVGLRYDQTVPTARILAQYQQLLPKYFRRYNIQNVFRADKPQAGRYREFTQCDPDIFGSTSPLADAEIIAVTYWALKNIGFNPQLIINDRQVLFTTLSPFATNTVSVASIIQTIDKLDKMTQEAVVTELSNKGLTPERAKNCLECIKDALPTENLKTILKMLPRLGVDENNFGFNPSIARGLDYYTGMIFEVKLPEYDNGSVGGGGRYDNLIKQLGGPDIPAVGIGLGFDRIVEAAIKLQLIPDFSSSATILIGAIDETCGQYLLESATSFRKNGVKTEIYPAIDKPGKILSYANKQKYPYVSIIGPDEASKGVVTLKNMTTGEQTTAPLDELISTLKP